MEILKQALTFYCGSSFIGGNGKPLQYGRKQHCEHELREA